MNKQDRYRQIPNVNNLLKEERFIRLSDQYGREVLKKHIQNCLDKVRSLIESDPGEEDFDEALSSLRDRIEASLHDQANPRIKKVINGSGTVLHTNLGRAPLSKSQLDYIKEIACGYSNLEYDLEKGERGERYSHFEKLLCRITGAEAAMAVNNNAAAVLLALSALAADRETIVSRGELIEIGGKFRIPDVCRQSGTILKEVGTTNKTHPEDYKEAISENTGVILKAHTSNFKIMGFSESVDAAALVEMAATYNEENQTHICVIEDMGSGALIDFSDFGLPHEPMVEEEIKKGVDIVTFSGDKLLGGPQAGIIVGKKYYIDKIKKHPLTRALRVDKFTVTALELVLRDYQSKELAVKNIPVLSMLSATSDELKEKAERLRDMLLQKEVPFRVSVIPCRSCVGGGSMPMTEIPGFGICLESSDMTLKEMEEAMRRLPLPVIGRITEDKFILDVRTIAEDEFMILAEEIASVPSHSSLEL